MTTSRTGLLEKHNVMKYRRENNMLKIEDHDWLQTATMKSFEEMWAEEHLLER